MNSLKIEATKYIPGVSFDSGSDVFDIKGDSYPENSAELYAPAFSWLKEYLKELKDSQKVTVNIALGYFNSSSSQILIDFFDILEKAAKTGKHITVNWIYDEENEISLEHGQEFQDDLEAVRFNLIPNKDAE